jgi:hypothetical protein
MVKEVSINFGKQRKLTKALFALKEQLEQLPSVDEAEVRHLLSHKSTNSHDSGPGKPSGPGGR